MPLVERARENGIWQVDLLYVEVLVLGYLGFPGQFRATARANQSASEERARRVFLAVVEITKSWGSDPGSLWLEREELELLSETPEVLSSEDEEEEDPERGAAPFSSQAPPTRVFADWAHLDSLPRWGGIVPTIGGDPPHPYPDSGEALHQYRAPEEVPCTPHPSGQTESAGVEEAEVLQDKDDELSYTDEQGYWQEIWSPDYDKREVSVYGSGSDSD